MTEEEEKILQENQLKELGVFHELQQLKNINNYFYALYGDLHANKEFIGSKQEEAIKQQLLASYGVVLKLYNDKAENPIKTSVAAAKAGLREAYLTPGKVRHRLFWRRPNRVLELLMAEAAKEAEEILKDREIAAGLREEEPPVYVHVVDDEEPEETDEADMSASLVEEDEESMGIVSLERSAPSEPFN